VAAVLPARAQEVPGAFHLGLRGGFSQANLYGDDISGSDFRPGFSGGVFATYDVNSSFSIQPEVLYTTKGAKNVQTPTGLTRLRADYLEVPVLFKLSAPLKPVTPRLYVGPSLGILLNAEANGIDAGGVTRDVDIGGVIGGEIAFDLSRVSRFVDELALDGRYSMGFLETDSVAENADVFNNNFAGKLSLRFPIGKRAAAMR
jgi:hypothetical protein